MATSPKNGWTAASLLPNLASGFSPGFSVGSRFAPAQVSGNPQSLKVAASGTANTTRQTLLSRILGKPQIGKPAEMPGAPAKQPNQNVAVNSFSTQGFNFLPGI